MGHERSSNRSFQFIDFSVSFVDFVLRIFVMVFSKEDLTGRIGHFSREIQHECEVVGNF